MKTLRTLIFETQDLEEAAISVDQASSRGLALYVESIRNPAIILHEPNPKGTGTWVIAQVDASLTELTNVLNFPDEIVEISTLSAEKGFGPLMYELLSSAYGWIMADRETVSGQARSVWKKMMDRPDWERVWIESARYQHDSNRDNPLNYLWKIKTPLNFSRLVENHKRWLSDEIDFGRDKEHVIRQLRMSAHSFFNKKWRGSFGG